MFNVEEYKNYLIDYYCNECDNNEERRNKRKDYLERNYSDEYLQRIINDTLNFISTFVENNFNNQKGYIEIDLLENLGGINLNISGGWFSDVLYSVGTYESELIISRHLLEEFFENDFRIEEDHKVEEVVDEFDEDVCTEYYYPLIRITGDFSILQEKYEELKIKKQNELIRVLKKIVNI